MIYLAHPATPELIEKLHKGEYFVIDADGHKQVFTDFIMKMFNEKHSPRIVLQEVKQKEEEIDRMWDDVFKTCIFSSMHDQTITMLKKEYHLIKK